MELDNNLRAEKTLEKGGLSTIETGIETDVLVYVGA
jgi:hypothetical protein